MNFAGKKKGGTGISRSKIKFEKAQKSLSLSFIGTYSVVKVTLFNIGDSYAH